jgi:LmbE family N-acetylglucosaminyl deacetylase
VTTSVAVSPHLDDVVLSCYSVLGPETTVVTVFAGVPEGGVLGSWDATGGATSSRVRLLERREEDRRALLLTESKHRHLDFLDGQLWGQAGIEPPTIEELASALERLIAGVDAVYAPAGIHNEEHKLVRDGVLAVLPNATLYADLPYALHPNMGGFALPPEVPTEGRKRRDRYLNSPTAAEKVESCRCYASQLRQLTAIFGPFLSPRALCREALWEQVS